MKDHFSMMARYNEWANGRVYDAASRMSDDDYRRDTGVFFKSMHGTLNHILVADQIWLNRLTGSGPHPSALDEVLYDDFESLHAARKAEDLRIIDVVDLWSEAELAAKFSYTAMTSPDHVTQIRGPALTHFFNHQTHHRGHAHAILTIVAGAAPELDLVYFQRETGIGL